MITLSAKIRDSLGRKAKTLKEKGLLPAVLYGPKLKTFPLTVDQKDFEGVLKEAGQSSLVSLQVEGGPSRKENLVLIYEIQKEPLSGKPSHVDFYQPDLTKKVEAEVSLVFEGEAGAVKDLGGTLIRNMSEVKVRALPQDLPKEIKVDISSLKVFADSILVKDLSLPPGVEAMRDPNDAVALVAEPQKVEEELEKPIEEKVEEVEVVDKKKTEEEPATEETPRKA